MKSELFSAIMGSNIHTERLVSAEILPGSPDAALFVSLIDILLLISLLAILALFISR